MTAGQNDRFIVSKPVPIEFPRYMKPLVSVACGQAHAMVLTVSNELYSWGSGSYGALGFGSRDDKMRPEKLNIFDHKGNLFPITQICCGKFHSMALTDRKNIYTWGEGSHGRLGHGDYCLDDQLYPKEIYTLSQRKPIFISAGESHSAAITEKNNLYTWGNGGFGRLGHGADNSESAPKLVQDLSADEMKVVYVSCGTFHTIVVL